MTDEEFQKLRIDLILRRVGGRTGYKAYMIGVIISLAVALLGGLAIFIMYVENLRR